MGAVQLQSNPEGQARVTLATPTVATVTYAGYCSRALMERVLAEFDALLDANPGIHSILWNNIELTGYDAGNSAITMKWLAQRPQVRRGAMVTRSQALASLVHVARVMLAGYETQAFRTPEEALEWLDTPLVGRPRLRSGRFKKIV